MALLEAAPPAALERSSCTYTSCYCEENVYKLVETLAALGVPLTDLFVTFVSNPHKQVPLWEQRAGDHQGFIVWDYHVILLQRTQGSEHCVWDLDTLLPFPVPFSEYCRLALRPNVVTMYLPKRMHRRYRVVPAGDYLRHFASDRSHMLAADGSWNAPPPSYPCITTTADGALHTLPQYLEMTLAAAVQNGTGARHSGGGSGGVRTGNDEPALRFGQVLLEEELIVCIGGEPGDAA